MNTMTDEERAKAIEDMLANPEKLKAETLERARKEQPNMTDEQLEAAWELAAKQLL